MKKNYRKRWKKHPAQSRYRFHVINAGRDVEHDKGRAYHIGYVVDDELNVIEAKGRDYGVVKKHVDAGGWNAYGRPEIFAAEIEGGAPETPADVDDAPSPESSAAWKLLRLLKLTSPVMRNNDVKTAQAALIAAGFDCGDSGADGVFGPDTNAAVKAYQEAQGLTVDGIIGKNTCTALGGVWQK